MKANQTIMMGPKRKAILEEPKDWAMNRSIKIARPMITS
jgi:hypothetical protein